MKCPVCSYSKSSDTSLDTEGFHEQISECGSCGAVWSINHGLVEVVADSQCNSFLEATSEPVEADDYVFA